MANIKKIKIGTTTYDIVDASVDTKISTAVGNLDGTATLNMYELKPIEMQLTTDYVTREEFEAALSKILNSEKLQQPVEQQPKQKVQQPLNF